MEWEKTYNRLIEILYSPDVTDEDLKAASAIAAISIERRSDVTSTKVQQDFMDAIVKAGQAIQAKEMPPDDLRQPIRALFLDA